jgi:hypothetical protein
VNEPTKPPAFDPRRLADLAARLAAAPAPAPPAQPSSPEPYPASSSSPEPYPASSSSPEPYPAQSGVDARVDEVGPSAGTGGPVGHPQVDAVLAELERAEQLPPDQQISVYESVHRTLQETLRSIEQN